MDANVVKIQLRQQSRQKTQLFYGLSAAAKQYPAINQLSDLAGIENLLQYTRHWLLAGKDKGLQKELTIANQVLQQQYPDIVPLTKDTLSMASLLVNGSRNIHFQRVQLDNNNAITHYLGVYNQYS